MDKRKTIICESLTAFLAGGLIYCLIEILFRGYTHWSMGITGGLCFLIMHSHFSANPDEGILTKCLYGMVVITSLEFITGCIVNLLMGWDVWDYSDMYMNFLGQICVTFSSAWFLLTLPVAYLSDAIHSGMRRISGN